MLVYIMNIIQYVVGTLSETNIAPWKSMVGILVSFWEGLFSGAAMLVSGRVDNLEIWVPEDGTNTDGYLIDAIWCFFEYLSWVVVH